MNNDPVNNPSHYTSGKIQVIDFVEDQKLGFHLGNVVKYVARAGKKDPSKLKEDLEKARWYLNRFIDSIFIEEEPKKIEYQSNEETVKTIRSKTTGDVLYLSYQQTNIPYKFGVVKNTGVRIVLKYCGNTETFLPFDPNTEVEIYRDSGTVSKGFLLLK